MLNTRHLCEISTLSQPWPAIPGIDAALAMAHAGESPVMFKKLLAMMLKNYSGWSATWLNLAREQGAACNPELCSSLHKLRGSASMLGATRLAEMAERAEHSLRGTSESPLEQVACVASALDELLGYVGHRLEIAKPIAP
jgi:two-component system sensor histidine kinase/response regulator